MSQAAHSVRVLQSPVPGVHGTLTRSGQRFPKHWHDVYSFGFILAGAQKWSSGRGTVRGYAGDAICTNPAELHDGEPLGDETRHWMIFSVDVPVMRSFAQVSAGDVELRAPVMRDPELVLAFRRLAQRLETTEPLAFEEALTTACTRLVSRHGAAPVQAREVAADVGLARERLADDLSNPPTLNDLAVLTGLSRFQVLRRFARAYGMPPHAWLRTARVERARRLIRGGMTLAAAATAAGFADQSHMTRAFTRHFGFTPGAWRASSRSAISRARSASVER